MSNLIWQMPLCALAMIIVVRLIRAPFQIAQEDAVKIAHLETEELKMRKALSEIYFLAGSMTLSTNDPTGERIRAIAKDAIGTVIIHNCEIKNTANPNDFVVKADGSVSWGKAT